MFFSDKDSTQNIEHLAKNCKKFLELQVQLLKLETTEKLTLLLSGLVVAAICIVIGLVILFYLSLAIAFWMSNHVGGPAVAFGIITAFHALLLTLLVCFRKRLIIRPITAFLGNILLSKDGEAQQTTEKP